jgi:hypothetical protein
MNPMKRLASLFAFLFFATTVSLAQLGIYAGFTDAKLDTANTSRFNGGTFGAFYDGSHFPLLNLGIDLRGAVLPSNSVTKVNSITAGPRLVLHLPHVPLRPYGELLLGEAHIQTGQGVAATDASGLDATAAAGIDLRILPHLDWRVLDYSFSRLNAAHTYQNSFTTGLVFRIPFS